MPKRDRQERFAVDPPITNNADEVLRREWIADWNRKIKRMFVFCFVLFSDEKLMMK